MGGATCSNCGKAGKIGFPILNKLCPDCRKKLGVTSKKKPR